jgi:hypothetical protein
MAGTGSVGVISFDNVVITYGGQTINLDMVSLSYSRLEGTIKDSFGNFGSASISFNTNEHYKVTLTLLPTSQSLGKLNVLYQTQMALKKALPLTIKDSSLDNESLISLAAVIEMPGEVTKSNDLNNKTWEFKAYNCIVNHSGGGASFT